MPPTHAFRAQEGGRLGEAAELYESILRHFAGGAPPPAGDAAGGSPVAAALGAGSAAGGSLLDVPPSAVANLCVCYVMGSQNEAAEELLRRLEDETTAAEAGAAGTAGAAAVPPHLCLANLAIGTLYCAKGALRVSLSWRGRTCVCLGLMPLRRRCAPPCCSTPWIDLYPAHRLHPGNFEFGITRVMRALEPLGGCLDAPRWHAVLLCLLAMMDQVGAGSPWCCTKKYRMRLGSAPAFRAAVAVHTCSLAGLQHGSTQRQLPPLSPACPLLTYNQVSKNMLVLKDALVADLLSFLEDVESTGRGMAALGAAAPSGGGASQQGLQTVAGQARAVRALLTKMHD